MKKLLFLSIMLQVSFLQAQDWSFELGTNYVYANPTSGMGHVIDRGHGVGINAGMLTPDQRFAVGIDFSYAQYGRDKSRQVYTFDDGSTANMDVIVSNNFGSVMAYGKMNLVTAGTFRPYVFTKVGYTFFSTNLNIYDPDDFDHCEPVESDVLYNDRTFTGAIGAGLRFDIAAIFQKLEKGKFYVDASIHSTHGGQVRYMNSDATAHTNGGNHDSDQVLASFLNTQTQIVHRHHVGNLYKSRMQMTELRFGVSMQLSK
ncbi:MAG TPA: hypothetical protein VD927_16365 [Chryseosolibacter sp.]|nr:hypothetical protein [Chryseosolibacter sp.]